MQLQDIDFSTLEIRELGSWPLILRAAVIFAVCCLTIGLLYFLLISKSLTALSTAKDEQMTKRKEFKEKYSMAVNFDAYKKQMVEMQSTYQDFLKRLPLTSNVPQLLSDITEIGEVDSLTFGAIKLGEPKVVAGFYKELLISLDITGSYQNFGKFLSDVSKLPRIITLGDFVIKPVEGNKSSNRHTDALSAISQDDSDQNPTSNILSIQIDAKTYWISEDTSTTPASGAQAAPGAPPSPGSAPTMPPMPGPGGAAPNGAAPPTKGG